MGEFVDLIDKIGKYYKFTPSELKGFIITILILGFIVGFNDGRATTNIDWFWIKNLINSILIVTFTLLIRESAHKIAALSVGYRAEYKMWTFGLLIHHMAGHRLGFFRYGLDYFGTGLVSATGPIANMLMAVFLKALMYFNPLNQLLQKAILFNIVFAVYTILPIPPMDGSRMLFGSRMVYAFIFCSIIGGAIFLLIDIPVLLSVLGALVVGFLGWILYYVFWEKGLWGGPYPKW